MDSDIIVMLIVSMCPASLFVGAVGTIFLLHAMGVRWPWEGGMRGRDGNHRYESTVRRRITMKAERVPSQDLPRVVQEHLMNGWTWVASREVTAAIWTLYFDKEL